VEEWRAFVNAIMSLQIEQLATVLYRVNVLLLSDVEAGLLLCKGGALKTAGRIPRTVLERCAKEEGLEAAVRLALQSTYYAFTVATRHAYHRNPVVLWNKHCATSREGRGFDSRWCHWNFSLTLSFWPHYGPGVDSAFDRNEYQEWGVKAAGA